MEGKAFGRAVASWIALERAVASWIQEPLLVEGIEEWNTKRDGKTRRRPHIKKRVSPTRRRPHIKQRGPHLDPLIFRISQILINCLLIFLPGILVKCLPDRITREVGDLSMYVQQTVGKWRV